MHSFPDCRIFKLLFYALNDFGLVYSVMFSEGNNRLQNTKLYELYNVLYMSYPSISSMGIVSLSFYLTERRQLNILN